MNKFMKSFLALSLVFLIFLSNTTIVHASNEADWLPVFGGVYDFAQDPLGEDDYSDFGALSDFNTNNKFSPYITAYRATKNSAGNLVTDSYYIGNSVMVSYQASAVSNKYVFHSANIPVKYNSSTKCYDWNFDSYYIDSEVQQLMTKHYSERINANANTLYWNFVDTYSSSEGYGKYMNENEVINLAFNFQADLQNESWVSSKGFKSQVFAFDDFYLDDADINKFTDTFRSSSELDNVYSCVPTSDNTFFVPASQNGLYFDIMYRSSASHFVVRKYHYIATTADTYYTYEQLIDLANPASLADYNYQIIGFGSFSCSVNDGSAIPLDIYESRIAPNLWSDGTRYLDVKSFAYCQLLYQEYGTDNFYSSDSFPTAYKLVCPELTNNDNMNTTVDVTNPTVTPPVIVTPNPGTGTGTGTGGGGSVSNSTVDSEKLTGILGLLNSIVNAINKIFDSVFNIFNSLLSTIKNFISLFDSLSISIAKMGDMFTLCFSWFPAPIADIFELCLIGCLAIVIIKAIKNLL